MGVGVGEVSPWHTRLVRRRRATGRAIVRVLPLVLAVVLAAAACTPSAPPATDEPTSTSPTSTGTPAETTAPTGKPLPGLTYVALGDSFAAGALLPPVIDSSGGCFRSRRSYPPILARRLGTDRFRSVACGGATSDHIAAAQVSQPDARTHPPQVEALGPRVDVVTITLGGNDAGLFGSVFVTCLHRPEGHRRPGACRDSFRSGGVDQARVRADAIGPGLTESLRRVRAAAPEARVYLVGYPRLLPDEGTCPDAGLGAADVAWGRGLERLLDRRQAEAATAAGVEFVSMQRASRGHDVCAGSDSWVTGKGFQLGGAAPYHPNQRGTRAIAEILDRRIRADRAG